MIAAVENGTGTKHQDLPPLSLEPTRHDWTHVWRAETLKDLVTVARANGSIGYLLDHQGFFWRNNINQEDGLFLFSPNRDVAAHVGCVVGEGAAFSIVLLVRYRNSDVVAASIGDLGCGGVEHFKIQDVRVAEKHATVTADFKGYLGDGLNKRYEFFKGKRVISYRFDMDHIQSEFKRFLHKTGEQGKAT